MPDAPPVITTTLPVMSPDFPAGLSIFSTSANRSIDGTIDVRSAVLILAANDRINRILINRVA
jgi:hypothetical protein